MGFNVTVDVYSVVQVAHDDLKRLERYLYDHTTIVQLPEHSVVNRGRVETCVVLLKTTCTRNVYEPDQRESHNTGVHIADELSYGAHRLANYQLDRLASGLLPGLLCGSRNEAEEIAADVLSNLRSR